MELSFLKRFKQKSVKDYRTIELEATNSKLSFELMDALRDRIRDLERENELLREFLGVNRESEVDASSHMIAPPLKAKRVVRSIGEIRNLLEARSRAKVSLGKEIDEDEVVVGP